MKVFLYWVRRVTPRRLRRAMHRIAEFLGDEMIDRRPQFGGDATPSVAGTLAALHARGFRPRTVVDVGAFRGDWTVLVKQVFPDAEVLMVEPQARLRSRLEDLCRRYDGIHYRSALLGAAEGTEVVFSEMATGSSVFEERSPVPRTYTPMRATTLDTATADACGWDRIDLLKLDVQGYELEVLKGATSYLPRCELVLLEASLIPVNRGCPLVDEVIAFMRARGFRLLDICSLLRRRDGALWQVDLLFIHPASPLVPAPELTAENW